MYSPPFTLQPQMSMLLAHLLMFIFTTVMKLSSTPGLSPSTIAQAAGEIENHVHECQREVPRPGAVEFDIEKWNRWMDRYWHSLRTHARRRVEDQVGINADAGCDALSLDCSHDAHHVGSRGD